MIKKSIVYAFVAASLVVAPAALAAQFYSGDQVQLSSKEALSGNAYAAGGTVDISTPVKGDLFVAGGTVRITAPVSGDLFVSGGNVTVEGPVSGDVRMAGGSVILAGEVKGETMLAGGDVTIASDATVNDVWVGTGQLTVAGTTNSIHGAVGEMTVSSGAHIKGSLNYVADSDATVAAGAVIDGKVSRTAPPQTPMRAKTSAMAAFLGGGVVWFIGGLLMLLLFAYLLPNKAVFLAKDWRANFGVNLLWGVIGMIVMPIVGLLLLVSFVGTPLGLGLLIIYGVSLYFAHLVLVLAVGVWVKSLWMKGELTKVDWVAVIIGAIVVALLHIIPVLGGLLLLVGFITALGAVMRNDWALVKKLRASKDF